jgi:hypothetical protein
MDCSRALQASRSIPSCRAPCACGGIERLPRWRNSNASFHADVDRAERAVRQGRAKSWLIRLRARSLTTIFFRRVEGEGFHLDPAAHDAASLRRYSRRR